MSAANTETTPPPDPASPSPTAELLRELQRLVQRNTRHWKRLIVLEMIAVLIAAPLAYLWVVFSLDILVHLPRWGRIATSAVFVLVLAGLGRWIWRRWKEVRLTEDQVALAIERQTPGTSNQLINSLQISREAGVGGSDPGMAVLRENHASLQRIHLRQAAKMRPALIRLGIAAVVVGIGVGFYIFQQAHFTNAAARIFQPFAKIAPLYRTTLQVEPGDVQAVPGSAVTIRIRIQGQRPAKLAVLQSMGEMRNAEQVAVPVGADHVQFTFRNLQRSLTYTVSGGDYTTPVYNIEVPLPPQVNLVRAMMHLPEYTRVAPQKLETHGGDLEALQGTRAQVTFVLDQPADTATLLLDGAGVGAPVELKRISPTEFGGEILFKQVLGYQVQVRRGQQTPGPSLKYGLRVLPDQPPQLSLGGLEKQTEVQLGAELHLKLNATDDFGLAEAVLVARRATSAANPKAGPQTSEDGWQTVASWPQLNLAREFKFDQALAVAALGAVEGERVELALRARDADPAKGKAWTTSELVSLLVGGEGTIFQVLYEQILQSEADLKQLIATQQSGVTEAAKWIQKLDPSSGLRWDDQKNLDALATAMRDQAKRQEQTRQTTGAVARDLVSAAGNLKFSLGMLADTEMVRGVRVLEAVPAKDDPQGKRAALAEARFTQERTIRSLSEILEQYVQFRQNWELANMTPFVKMLADRQAALRDESAANAGKPGAPLVMKSAGQRQAKILTLTGLAQVALGGVGERTAQVDALLGQAFTTAAMSLDSTGAKAAMQQAATQVAQGQWSAAAPTQTKAATALADIHAKLKQAGAEAIARAMKEIERQESLLAAQKALEKLMPGSGVASETFRQDLANISQVVEMRETAAAKKKAATEALDKAAMPPISADLAAKMKTVESDARPDLSTLRLGSKAEATKALSPDNLPPNAMVAPLVPDKIEDLIGKLLDEADEMSEKFDSLTVNSGLISADPGEVGKLAGRMNSSGATSTTGNKKPPTANVGGMSATGRQGARSYGKVAGSESPNMRGRDKVQEGQLEAPDQAGVLKEKATDDMQKDQSTGIGGKRVEAEQTKFSLSNKGEWEDKYTDRMQKPQKINSIVERQGKPLDPKVAAMLRDMDGDQKQLIERANALRKELKNVFLPTDHLDDLIAKLNQNLEKLRENPTAETFRTQQELIDRLRSEARVFNRGQNGFQPSLPRDQQVRGRILDEPASQPLPAYERLVKDYYRKLASP